MHNGSQRQIVSEISTLLVQAKGYCRDEFDAPEAPKINKVNSTKDTRQCFKCGRQTSKTDA